MKLNYYNHYKLLRNQLTSKKRESKIQYYKSYFEKNQQKSAALWKGIRSLVNIKPTNKSDVSIIDNGNILTDPSKIANCFNQYFVNVGPTVESKLAKLTLLTTYRTVELTIPFS